MITDAEAARMLGLNCDFFPFWTQGVVITDSFLPDDPIIYANTQFAKLTGYETKEFIGQNCRFLQGPHTNRTTVSRIRDAIARRQLFVGEILNYRKDGTSFVNCLAVGPIRRLEEERYFVGLQQDAACA